MQVQLKVSPNVIVSAEADKQTDIFEQLAGLQEIFGEGKCGKCGDTNLRYVVRTVDDDKFYEVRCTKCWAVLTFGVKKKGNVLFPHRKENENGSIMGLKPGEKLPNQGWLIYDSQTKTKK
jgi:hypothetical protein